MPLSSALELPLAESLRRRLKDGRIGAFTVPVALTIAGNALGMLPALGLLAVLAHRRHRDGALVFPRSGGQGMPLEAMLH